MDWYLFHLPALCVLVALIGLDGYCVGQLNISRPIVLAPILGAYFRKLGIGLWVGGTLELMAIDDLAVGHWVPLNGTIAATTTLILTAGQPQVPLPAAFPIGVLLGAAFYRIETAIRIWRKSLVSNAESCIQRGRGVPGSLIARGLAVYTVALASFLYLGIATAGPAAAFAWPQLPQRVQTGLDLALQSAPWLGLATMVHVFRPR
jgi:mannose/fructose/N-acetylgalactosamine-specific phosphotransferase system component IIC